MEAILMSISRWMVEKEMATYSSILAWRILRDRGAWWAAVYEVAQSCTWLRWLSSSSSSIWMDKEVVVHTHNRILLSYKRNAFESVLMRWMNLEPIIQNEISQKEKDKYCMLLYICEYIYIWNLETWSQSYMQGSKGDTKNRLLDSVEEGECGMVWKNIVTFHGINTHCLLTVKL